MKRIVLFAVLMMAVALPYAAGQGAASSTGHFEWAKGYDSGFDNAYIVGTVTDSLGNLYILGQIHYDSDWDYTESVAPPLSTQNTMVLVAKISPEGEMVWKKMFGNDGSPTYANDIKPLGDTGFAVMFDDGMIFPGITSRYWGDSMRNDVNHPLISPCDTPGLRFNDGRPTIFISFDFDGNVIEQHALEITFLDSDGNDFERSMYQSPDSLPWLRTSSMYRTTFDVDNDGNIYVCYRPGDFPDSANYANYDRLAATRYWVDHRLVGESTLGNNTTEESLPYPQLVKFSPHFDTLLASRNLIQRSDEIIYGSEFYLKTDHDANVYVIVFKQLLGCSNTIVVDSINGFAFSHGKRSGSSFMTICDYQLNIKSLIYLTDSVINESVPGSALLMHGISFDYDSNLFFLAATTNRSVYGDTSHFYSILQYNGTALNIKGGSFFMSFERNTYPPVLHSYGRVPARITSDMSQPQTIVGEKIASKKNRVVLQAQYQGGIRFPDRNIIFYQNSKRGLCYVVFDYKGKVIGGEDYNVNNDRNFPSALALRDSVLYLTNFLNANATFGNTQYYVMSYATCVAKYVDPAFMDVYQPVGIAEVDVTNHTIYPNPVESLLHVRLENDNILQATAISVLGTKEQLDAVGNTVDVSRLQSGIYIMELTTVRGTNHFKFIKQ